MGSITAGRIIEQARYTLNDISDEVRWTDGELLRYLSDGQRLAVKLDHMANPVTEDFALDPSSKQDLPAHAYALIAAIRIMGGDHPEDELCRRHSEHPGLARSRHRDRCLSAWATGSDYVKDAKVANAMRTTPAPLRGHREHANAHTSATGVAEDAANRWDATVVRMPRTSGTTTLSPQE